MSVKAALIGYGYAGRVIHAPLIRAAQGLDLAAIVSSRPADVHAGLAAAIAAGAPPPVPLDETLVTMAILDLAIESAATGRRLEFKA